MSKIKVLIVEDHLMTKLGLQMVLERAENIEVAGDADNGKKGVEAAKKLLPDVILMDIGLPDMDGIEATKMIREAKLDSKILIYTSRDDEDDVFASFDAGADGYVMKGANEQQIVSAITAVAEGTAWLDPAIAKLVLSNIKRQEKKEEKSVTGKDNQQYKKYGLTEREYEVLCLITKGKKNEEIAEDLSISISTAKAHVHSILGKLYAENKHQATVIAISKGITNG